MTLQDATRRPRTPERALAAASSHNRVRTSCPVDSAHGRVLDAPGSRWGFYCPDQAHDGRPSTHPLGAAPATRAFFTTAEVEAGRLTDPATRSSVDASSLDAGESGGNRRTPGSPEGEHEAPVRG